MSKYKKHEDFYGTNKYGKRVKYGVHLVNQNDGTVFTALNPAGKARKYYKENTTGYRYCNWGDEKYDKDGKKIRLTYAQKSYRVGYIDCRKDEAKIYNAKRKKEGNKK